MSEMARISFGKVLHGNQSGKERLRTAATTTITRMALVIYSTTVPERKSFERPMQKGREAKNGAGCMPLNIFMSHRFFNDTPDNALAYGEIFYGIR